MKSLSAFIKKGGDGREDKREDAERGKQRIWDISYLQLSDMRVEVNRVETFVGAGIDKREKNLG